MDIEEMRKALDLLHIAVDHLEQAGEQSLSIECYDFLKKCLDRYEAEGGDTTEYAY